MRMLRTALLLTITAFVISSCQKEESFAEDALNNPPGSPGSGNINFTGTWRFVGMVAETGTSTEIVEMGETMKMEALLDYYAKNPSGTVTLTSNKMTTNSVGYLMSGVYTSRVWMDGSMVADISEEIEEITPPSSGNVNFVKVGNDSLSFDGVPLMVPGDVDMPTGASIKMGAKLRMSNDTLYMRFRFNQTLPMPDPSIPGTMRSFGDMIMALKK